MSRGLNILTHDDSVGSVRTSGQIGLLASEELSQAKRRCGGVEPLLASFDLASDHLNRQRNAFRFGDVVDRHLQHPGVAQIYAADAAGEDDATKAQVVMLRYFAGATTGETAASMNLSPATVKNEWAIARAWLRDALSTGIRRPERIAPEFVP